MTASPDDLVRAAHDAVEQGDVDRLRKLLDAGADVAARDPDTGQTLLEHASARVSITLPDPIAELLWERGEGVLWTPLLHALDNCEVAEVRRLLEASVDPNERHPRSGLTPIQSAVNDEIYGCCGVELRPGELVDLLLQHGADPLLPGQNDETAWAGRISITMVLRFE